MSVVYQKNHCIFISHEKYINSIYENHVKTSLDVQKNTTNSTFAINPNVFAINSSFNRWNQQEKSATELKNDCHKHKRRKRPKGGQLLLLDSNNNDMNDFIQRLKSDTNEFIESLHNNGVLQKKPIDILNNFYNADAQSIRNLMNNVNNILPAHFIGGNSSEYPIETPIASTVANKNNNNNNTATYLIPTKCLFFNNNVNQLENLLNPVDNKFDFIVLDPPWWNKFIKRARHSNKDYSYDTMKDEDILNIPLHKYIKSNSVVVIWCTNSPTHLKFIENQLIKKWNLKLITKWYWIKITNFGETICEFTMTPTKKQPYEQLLILYPINSSANDIHLNEIKQEQFIYSVPSAIHSHKPPIQELFRNYLPEHPKCLELFARYLLPGFTSVGLEVLKLQNTKLFHQT